MANFEHRTLQVVEAVATIVINRKMIEQGIGGIDRYIRTILPMQCENAVLSMVELFAADNIQNFDITYPLNWWEALKEATAPQIFLDRYPVRYHHVKIDLKAIWLGYKPPTNKYGPFLPYVLQQTETDGDDEGDDE